MDNSFPTIYLALLLSLLAVAAWAIFRQVLRTRKVESSLSRLQNKLKTEKGTPEEYYELASIYLDKNLFAQAISLLQKALKLGDIEEENLALIYNGLGFAYFAQEQYDIAIRHYKDAVKYKPDYVTALNNLGHAYERKSLTAQALEQYEAALQVEPNNQTAKRRVEALRKRVETPA